jgi:CHASE3 domain sensor protein
MPLEKLLYQIKKDVKKNLMMSAIQTLRSLERRERGRRRLSAAE